MSITYSLEIISSFIFEPLINVVPSVKISGVLSPAFNTSSTALSILSASFDIPNEYLSIIAPHRIVPIGLPTTEKTNLHVIVREIKSGEDINMNFHQEMRYLLPELCEISIPGNYQSIYGLQYILSHQGLFAALYVEHLI